MRYFHRTSVPPDDVLSQADAHFRALQSEDGTERGRVYSGSIGRVTLKVRAEGGHYTLVTIETDQVGESEADKLAKRFLSVVHRLEEPGHELRGAY